MTIIINGLAVGYDRLGSAKRVMILLHGWGASRKSLATIAKKLSKKYTVINIDVPGFGDSQKPDEVWGLGEYSQWLMDCVAKMGVSVDVLLGHSNGGAIAVKAVSSGLRVNKLVLLGASGIRKREKGKKLILKSVAKTGKVATVLLPKSVKKKVRGRWYKVIGSELYDHPGMEEYFKKITSEDLLIDSAMITIPTLLVYGSEDRATPPLYGKLYHETIEGSELKIIEGAGHYSFLDKPDQTLAQITKFLNV